MLVLPKYILECYSLEIHTVYFSMVSMHAIYMYVLIQSVLSLSRSYYVYLFVLILLYLVTSEHEIFRRVMIISMLTEFTTHVHYVHSV